MNFIFSNKWIEAARLPTLLLSLSSVIVGHSLAYSKNKFNLIIFIFSILTAVSLQILSNFANDYGDFAKGTDNENRLGPKRGLQSGKIKREELFFAILILIFASLIFGTLLLFYSFNEISFNFVFLFLIGIISILAAIFYTMGKTPYGYYALGDISVFIFFGIVAVAGNYFLQTLNISLEIFLPAICFGLLSVSILNLNNLRDIENDKISNKKTIIVILGLKKGKVYHNLLLSISIILLSIYCIVFSNYYLSLIFILFSVILFSKSFLLNTNIINFNLQIRKTLISIFVLSLTFSIFLFLN